VSDTLFGGAAGDASGEDEGPAGDDGRRSGRRRSGRRPAADGGVRDGGRRRQGGRSSGPQWSSRSAEPDAPGAAEDEMGDPETVARGICLRALTGAARTRKQLADLLAKKGVPEEAATAVLDRFTDVGLIDDAAFASAWVSSRQSGRGLARRALASELRAKGVDGEVAAAAVAEVDPQDEWDSARRLVERKLPSMMRLDRVTAERRLMGMLARKGYGGGLAGYVVREALDAAGAAEDAAAEAESVDDAPGWSAADAPVWTAARSAARSTRSAAGRAADDPGHPSSAGHLSHPDDEGASAEVGEGRARLIGRTRHLPAGLPDDDLP
jgi:SOS response regulatory protein OraA/RecX